MRFLVGMSFLLVFHTSLVLAESPIMRAGPVYIQPDVVSVAIEFPRGAPPRAPAPADFRLRLANKDLVVEAQKSEFFGDSGEGLALVVCVDVSGPIGPGHLNEIKEALIWLTGQESHVIRPNDKIALISFADEEETESSFEETPAHLAEAIRNLKIRGHKSKLYQTIFKALDMFQGPGIQGIPQRQRIILISDGKDEGSVDNSMSVTEKSKSLGIPIDTVGYGRIPPREKASLETLSTATYGQFVEARPDKLTITDALKRIYTDLLETRSLVVSFKYKMDRTRPMIQHAFVELTQLDQSPLRAKIQQPIPQPTPQRPVDIFINKENILAPKTLTQKLTTLIPFISFVIIAIIFVKKYLRRRRIGKVSPPTETLNETIGKDKATSRGSIFISYRREDSGDRVGRIYDRLSGHFSKTAVFMDVDSIPLGVDFRSHIERFVGHCNVILAVIGPKWISAVDKEGNSRLHNPQDHVRLELEAALNRGIPVIPLLVGGSLMPDESYLPPSLKQLSYRNGISVRFTDPDFNYDINRLIEGINSHLEGRID